MSSAAEETSANQSRPLLSICVPTYNRAHLLRIMLQALLPQAKEHEGVVEVIVSDNASPDDTSKIAEESRSLGPVRYSRNERNLNFVGNIVKLTTELARGQYVWLIGDDELMLPGALSKVVSTLAANQDAYAFYVNFQYTSFEKNWPKSAIGGYTGHRGNLHCADPSDLRLSRWKRLLRGDQALCGNMYANIVRRQVWSDYWKNREVPDPSSKSLMAIYPHTCMFADVLMERRAYYIAKPALVSFHGAQAFMSSYDRVVALYMPAVLRYYHKRGFNGPRFERCVKDLYPDCGHSLTLLLQSEADSCWRTICSYLSSSWRYPTAWIVLIRSIRSAKKPRILGKVLETVSKVLRFGKTSIRGIRLGKSKP